MRYIRKWIFTRGRLLKIIISLLIFTMVIYIAKTKKREKTKHKVIILDETAGAFYRYVLAKGLNIKPINYKTFRLSHSNLSYKLDISYVKNFERKKISWKDMFETDIEVLSKKTHFSKIALRKKMGVLPTDGTPVTLVATQSNMDIPKENVIIRLNNNGPPDTRTTMIMTWSVHIKTLTTCAREQPNNEIVHWIHYKPYGSDNDNGLWNTSIPIVVPEDVWGFENLRYYRGPLFFMKGGYFFGRFTECRPGYGIGLGAINRVVHLKGDISTLGYSTCLDEFNGINGMKLCLLAHNLLWSFFAVKELTDTDII